MLQRQAFLSRGTENAVPVKVYDLSISDLEERKAKAVVYKSMSECARRLYIPISSIESAMRRDKPRITSPQTGISYAIRIHHEKNQLNANSKLHNKD